MNRLILVLLVAASTAAAGERPRDFAYGSMLEVTGKQALYEATLPAAAYRGVARADLADIRVFNGAGEVVSYAWYPRRTSETEPQESVALTLFPLKGEAGTSVEGLSIRVRRGAGGQSSIDVTSKDTRASAGRRTIGYLVDLTGFDRALRAIDLDWQALPEGFAGQLRVDAGDDLASWRTLVAAAPLVSLQVGDQRLEQKRIELPGQKARYLRLSWVAQGAEASRPELKSVRGDFVGKSIETTREWITLEPGKAAKPGEYLFDLRGHFPADRVRLHLPEANTVVRIELLVRERSDEPWRPVGRGVAYRLQRDDAEIASPEIVIGSASERYWLLRVDQRGGGLGSGLPRLEAGWIPHRLVFAARGEPPFQLAYGNRNAKPAAHAIDTLIPGYRDERDAKVRAAKAAVEQTINVSSARMLEERELGGESRLKEVIDWKRWSLWGALILGVAVLGVMAWRLVRQLGPGSARPGSDAGGKN